MQRGGARRGATRTNLPVKPPRLWRALKKIHSALWNCKGNPPPGPTDPLAAGPGAL